MGLALEFTRYSFHVYIYIYIHVLFYFLAWFIDEDNARALEHNNVDDKLNSSLRSSSSWCEIRVLFILIARDSQALFPQEKDLFYFYPDTVLLSTWPFLGRFRFDFFFFFYSIRTPFSFRNRNKRYNEGELKVVSLHNIKENLENKYRKVLNYILNNFFLNQRIFNWNKGNKCIYNVLINFY